MSKKSRRNHFQRLPARQDRTFIARIHSLTGKEAISKILSSGDPREMVQGLAEGDFFWLVKKMDEEDCLTLLELASEEQWQYILDIELWSKDCLDQEATTRWLGRLHQADPDRLVKWLLSQGQWLIYYHLFKCIRVDIREEDEEYPGEDDFVSFDGVYYFKVLDWKERETIEGILRSIADRDQIRYQGILSRLVGVIPAELEEEMYRHRNVRLAEHGFLPYEEAISVYSHLRPERLLQGRLEEAGNHGPEEDIGGLAPVLPLYLAQGRRNNVLTSALSEIKDRSFLERIRLEFAGLCNQILSADGKVSRELEELVKICQKAAGYLNLALEGLCGSDTSKAKEVLGSNPLADVFRAGFGMALELKWEAEKWLIKSWFRARGLEFGFWGEQWGEVVAALVRPRPLYYAGPGEEDEYRQFENLEELEESRKILHWIISLDRLMEELTSYFSPDEIIAQDSVTTFEPLMITLWARQILGLNLGFTSISIKEMRELFALLRKGDASLPYNMPGYEEHFLEFYSGYTGNWEENDRESLREALSIIWKAFREEYELVPEDRLDPRFVRLLRVSANGN